jgi:hypothetical protein
MSIVHRGTTISGTAGGFTTTTFPPSSHFGWNVVSYPGGVLAAATVLDWGTTSGSTGAGGWQVSVSGLSGSRSFTVVIPASQAQAPAGFYRFYWIFSSSGTTAADIWYPTSTTFFEIVNSGKSRNQIVLF